MVHARVYTPGYTTIPALPGMVNVPVDTLSAVTCPWAQAERNPWVRASLRVKVLNSVRERRSLCAELLRLPEEKWMKDWIDTG